MRNYAVKGLRVERCVYCSETIYWTVDGRQPCECPNPECQTNKEKRQFHEKDREYHRPLFR